MATAPTPDLDTTDGRSIFLYKEGTCIVGRAETSVGSGANPQGDVAFALTIDNTGMLTVAQYLSLHHPDPTNPDDSLELSGFIAAQVTVTEADGDVADGVAGDCRRRRVQGRRPDADGFGGRRRGALRLCAERR